MKKSFTSTVIKYSKYHPNQGKKEMEKRRKRLEQKAMQEGVTEKLDTIVQDGGLQDSSSI